MSQSQGVAFGPIIVNLRGDCYHIVTNIVNQLTEPQEFYGDNTSFISHDTPSSSSAMSNLINAHNTLIEIGPIVDLAFLLANLMLMTFLLRLASLSILLLSSQCAVLSSSGPSNPIPSIIILRLFWTSVSANHVIDWYVSSVCYPCTQLGTPRSYSHQLVLPPFQITSHFKNLRECYREKYKDL